MARAVHSSAGWAEVDRFAASPADPFHDCREDCSRCRAAVAGDGDLHAASRSNRRDSPGEFHGDSLRDVRPQVVDCRVAHSFCLKQRTRRRPRGDFRQLPRLPGRQPVGIIAPRAAAAGRMEAGQSSQMNGKGNGVAFARTTVVGSANSLAHARYFKANGATEARGVPKAAEHS